MVLFPRVQLALSAATQSAPITSGHGRGGVQLFNTPAGVLFLLNIARAKNVCAAQGCDRQIFGSVRRLNRRAFCGGTFHAGELCTQCFARALRLFQIGCARDGALEKWLFALRGAPLDACLFVCLVFV